MVRFWSFKEKKIMFFVDPIFGQRRLTSEQLRQPIQNKEHNNFYSGSTPVSGNDLRPLRAFIDVVNKYSMSMTEKSDTDRVKREISERKKESRERSRLWGHGSLIYSPCPRITTNIK